MERVPVNENSRSFPRLPFKFNFPKNKEVLITEDAKIYFVTMGNSTEE